MNKAFFLDRDGVINVEVDYLHRAEDVELIPGTAEAIASMHEAGYLVIVTSNQSGIARGLFTWDDLRSVEQRIRELLGNPDSQPDAFYYCPHHRAGKVPEFTMDCDCRKPKPGLLLQAAREHDIDLSRSFMIGDKLSDLQAGDQAGCQTGILVQTGHGREDEEKAQTAGRIIKSGILEAANFLLSKNR